jgi:hypothetical protein
MLISTDGTRLVVAILRDELCFDVVFSQPHHLLEKTEQVERRKVAHVIDEREVRVL